MDTATRTSPVVRAEPLLLRRYLLPVGLATGLFWVAFDSATFSATGRATLGIAVWWAIVVFVALGLFPLARPTVASVVAAGFLGAFAVLALGSSVWGDSVEPAFAEFNRAALYLGVFVLAALGGARANADRWSDGLAVAVAAIGVLALTARLVPGLALEAEFPAGLQDAEIRLNYPLGYWNGLAVFIALGAPLLLRAGLAARSWASRGLAVGVLPPLAGAVYLTSSRGGVVAAIVAVVAFLLLVHRRLAATAAVLTAGLGSAAAVAVLAQRSSLADDPGAATSRELVSALGLILVVSALTGLLHGAITMLPRRAVRVPRAAVWAAAAIALGASASAVVALDPVERFEDFKRSPADGAGFEQEGFTGAHIASTAGTGRWQFWEAAVDQFAGAPLLGGGAGSYEAWWAQHGSFSYAITDAHSLYLETLGELGAVGLVLLVAFLAIPLVAGVRRALRAVGAERDTIAALLAASLAYVVAAGIDWMWELTAVSVLGLVCLGLLAGPATAVAPRLRPIERPVGPTRPSLVMAGAILVVGGWLVICTQAIVLLTALELRNSREAASSGDLVGALRDARGARSLQPWAATPYLQTALVEEQAGATDAAARSIREAIERNPSDWRLWLIAARIETKAELIEDAVRSLARAEALNPRSPIFADLRS
jgi:tetratricopeptide (TPR) repeat protein